MNNLSSRRQPEILRRHQAVDQPAWSLSLARPVQTGHVQARLVLGRRRSPEDRRGGRETTYENMPPQRNPKGLPEGGNQVYADVPAAWVRFEAMYYFQSCNTGGNRIVYWYQFPPDLGSRMLAGINTLSAQP